MERIILLTTLLEHDNPEQMAELRECIEFNIRNPEIDRLIVFFEVDKKADISSVSVAKKISH